MFMEELIGIVAELSRNVAQLSAMVDQLQETFVRMDTRITNLENNQHANNYGGDGGNIQNQRDQPTNNVY